MTTFGGNFLNSGIDSMLNLTSVDLVSEIGLMHQFTEGDVLNEEVVYETTAKDTSPMLASASGTFPSRIQPKQSVRGPSIQTFEDVHQPYVEIVEEPRQRGLRFRYQCEGRSAGSIPGNSSSAEKKTFPTIKIHNHRGPAIIVVSCVSKDAPYRPHPHALVGKDCKKGVCTVKVKDTTVISFPHLGIQCAKKKGIQDSLDLRKQINVDPYQTGFEFQTNTSEMSAVRLCFQVFLPDQSGKITKVLPPVVSQPIHDKKALNDLVICRVDRSSGKARGGDEVFLLCEKINKDDIGIRFSEESRDGSITWEQFGEFGAGDVHRQYAIVFKTPPYRDCYINRPAEVIMQLQRPSDGECSEPITFIYMPEDPDPDRIEEKRKRKAERMETLEHDINIIPRTSGAHVTVKDGLRNKLKANRKLPGPSEVKTETDVQASVLPTYSLSNIGSTSFTPSTTGGSSFIYRTTDNNSMGNITVAASRVHCMNSTDNSQSSIAYSIQEQCQLTNNLGFIDTISNTIDANMIDHQVLMEYLQDKGIESQDILSFESLDMLSDGTTESVLSGSQAVGANVLVENSSQDSNMDSDSRETFLNAQEALKGLQN